MKKVHQRRGKRKRKRSSKVEMSNIDLFFGLGKRRAEAERADTFRRQREDRVAPLRNADPSSACIQLVSSDRFCFWFCFTSPHPHPRLASPSDSASLPFPTLPLPSLPFPTLPLPSLLFSSFRSLLPIGDSSSHSYLLHSFHRRSSESSHGGFGLASSSANLSLGIGSARGGSGKNLSPALKPIRDCNFR